MKRRFVLGLVAALGSIPSMAVDITIPDSYSGGDGKFGSLANSNGGAYNGTLGGFGTAGEDQEVSAGAVANQSWDLEAFTLTGTSLGIIAGFDMRTGIANNGFGSVNAAGVGTTPYKTDQGDIFIKVGTRVDARDAGSSPHKELVPDGFDFDYVIKFNSIAAGGNGVSYSVYSAANVTPIPETSSSEINPGAALLTGYLYKVTPNGGNALYSGTAGYLADQTSAQVGGYVGTDHDVISGINLDYSMFPLFLPNSDVYLYTTMGCGNDIMEGKFTVPVTVPDGGMTLALLGAGFLGVGALRRRSA